MRVRDGEIIQDPALDRLFRKALEDGKWNRMAREQWEAFLKILSPDLSGEEWKQ